ncbi:MAG: hypothetical protein ACOYKN_18930, partial [Pirellula sp.]
MKLCSPVGRADWGADEQQAGGLADEALLPLAREPRPPVGRADRGPGAFHPRSGFRLVATGYGIAYAGDATPGPRRSFRSCLASDFVVLVLSEAVLSPPRRTVLVLDGCL